MKNRIKYLFILFVISSFCYAQKANENATNQKVVQVKVKPIIYLLGGIVSAITQKEIDFAKKYNIAFHDFGCLAPTNLNDYEKLNFKTFELLNIQFGPKWQEDIKPTVLGFSKWKENNK
jgi:hypothetical protein